MSNSVVTIVDHLEFCAHSFNVWFGSRYSDFDLSFCPSVQDGYRSCERYTDIVSWGDYQGELASVISSYVALTGTAPVLVDGSSIFVGAGLRVGYLIVWDKSDTISVIRKTNPSGTFSRSDKKLARVFFSYCSFFRGSVPANGFGKYLLLLVLTSKCLHLRARVLSIYSPLTNSEVRLEYGGPSWIPPITFAHSSILSPVPYLFDFTSVLYGCPRFNRSMLGEKFRSTFKCILSSGIRLYDISSTSFFNGASGNHVFNTEYSFVSDLSLFPRRDNFVYRFSFLLTRRAVLTTNQLLVLSDFFIDDDTEDACDGITEFHRYHPILVEARIHTAVTNLTGMEVGASLRLSEMPFANELLDRVISIRDNRFYDQEYSQVLELVESDSDGDYDLNAQEHFDLVHDDIDEYDHEMGDDDDYSEDLGIGEQSDSFVAHGSVNVDEDYAYERSSHQSAPPIVIPWHDGVVGVEATTSNAIVTDPTNVMPNEHAMSLVDLHSFTPTVLSPQTHVTLRRVTDIFSFRGTQSRQYTPYAIPASTFRSKTDLGDCSICLNPMNKGDSISIAHDSHIFHESCIARWFSNNRTCPICRKTIPSKAAPL